MRFDLRWKLTRSAREVIRWCTPERPWLDWPWLHIGAHHFSDRWYEPAYVASFVLYGVPELAAAWREPLNAEGLGLCITGVFCHQSPKVGVNRSEWWPDGSCELGDLLVVHDHLNRDGEIEHRRAVLVQAKMPHATGSFADNPRQTFLYTHWPDFVITSPKIFGRRMWHLSDNSEGARYAFIRPSTPHRRLFFPRSPWTFAPCIGAIAPRGEDMARFMVGMLDFDGGATRGRPATPGPGAPDDWSTLIEEMLAKMALRAFANKQLLGPKRGRRVVSAFATMQTDDVTLQFVCAAAVPSGIGGGRDAEPRPPEEANPGVSTVLIETSAQPD